MIHDIVTIDLAMYGDEGIIELTKPSFRKKQIMKNDVGRCMGAYVDEYGRGQVKDTPLGDIEIIKAMSYVKRAPFAATLKGFLDYCDILDERNGSAESLFEEIQEKIKVLETAPGPLESSVTAETEN